MRINFLFKSALVLGVLTFSFSCKNTGASSDAKDIEFPTGETHWEAVPVSEKIDIKGPVTGSEVSRSVSLETNIRQLEKVKTFSIQRVMKDISYTELVCPSVAVYGDGSGGEWYGYWDLKDQESKAAALSKAIKGVGPARAHAIASWTDQEWLQKFSKKPRNWTEFKKWMNAVDDRLSNNPKYKDLRGIAAVTTDQWGSENMKSLGYAPRSQVDCRLETRTKTIETLEDRWADSFKLVSTVRKTTTVTVKVSGLNLLPGETETVSVSFDGISNPSASPEERFHSMTAGALVEGNATISYQASRKLVPAANTVDVRISKAGNQIKVDAFDNSYDQLAPYKAAGTVSITLSIKKDGNFWVFSPNKKQNLSNMELSGKQGSQSFTLDNNFKPGENIYVEYSIKRLGSTFYDSNNWSESKTSTALTW